MCAWALIDLRLMDLRLRSLFTAGASASGDDDEGIALPHGTEVVSRVDKAVANRRIGVGTVGRVTKSNHTAVEVTIVGVGVVTYDRSEIAPRRVGQQAYARRRHAAWEALSDCVVLTSVVGSRAWGLSNEGSDEDRRGVFALPFDWSSGLLSPPEDLVSADGSSTYWSVAKCIGQALRADPNTLEMLFVASASASDEIGQWLLAERDAFVSKEIYGTFGRYAVAQLQRLEQGQRLYEHRALVLSWLREDPALTLDIAAERLADITKAASRNRRVFPTREAEVQQAKQWLKQLYRSLADQGLMVASDWASLVELARRAELELDLPRELRPKNAYNLLRLIWTATTWLSEGAPTFEASGEMRARLLRIKRGEVPLDEVLEEAEGMLPALEAARDQSQLPDRPDVGRADKLLRRVATEIARRRIEAAPGPWGADAAEPPEATWAQ